jgi:hypothetical protein
MFSPSLAQIHAEYRQAELVNTLAAERLVRSAQENGVSAVADRASITRRIFDLVTDVPSNIGRTIAAAGRRPHGV